jgi:voltage-gated potassium channel
MPDREDRSADGREMVLTAASVVLATVVYFLLPTPGRMREASWGFLFGGGVLVLGALIALSIRHLMRATAGVRARGLIVLLSCGVLFFAWANVTLAAIPGQFADLHTKVDSVYFSVSTLATVGFGDVHAAGQLARAAVTIQMLFNLVFLGTAVTFVTGIMRQRVATTRRRALEGGHQATGQQGSGQQGSGQHGTGRTAEPGPDQGP